MKSKETCAAFRLTKSRRRITNRVLNLREPRVSPSTLFTSSKFEPAYDAFALPVTGTGNLGEMMRPPSIASGSRRMVAAVFDSHCLLPIVQARIRLALIIWKEGRHHLMAEFFS